MRQPLLASRNACTGCMACVDACPRNALSAHIAPDGHVYPSLHPEKCIHCNRCTQTCPIVNRYDHESNECSQPYAAWANDSDLRMRSSSGGVFAAIATKILKENGCVAGAVMEGLDVRHRLIDRLEDLPLLQGSKYQQGDLTGIYREVKLRLKQDYKVLFSGTGCQVGALYAYLSAKKYSGQLITIDLVCGGFPSLLPLQALVRQHDTLSAICSFRDKSTGWKSRGYTYALKMTDRHGKEVNYGRNNIVTETFSSHVINRSSCLNCHFAKASRRSDLTLADFWGDKDYPEEHYKGLSAVVAHSPEGKKLLAESDITSYPISWEKFLPYNHRMINGRFRFLNLHPARIFAPFFFTHCSYDTLKQLYAVAPVTWRWFPYRAWHGVIMRLSKTGSSRKVKKTLKNLGV